ncbi:MAG: LamG domain-containing protein, partial [Bacteroidales bacterium]|nr:LamG domain-containing protein [Bacteroidales bacterium]
MLPKQGTPAGNYFDGTLDDVRIWNVARTEQQIRENMHKTLSQIETGLISYWQMNESSGNIANDNYWTNDGTLINMTDDDWFESTVPTGGGVSNTQTEVNGLVAFTGPGLRMDYTSQNGASVTATRLDLSPNLNPVGPDTVFDNQYWIVNRFGNGTFDTDLTFIINEDLTTTDQNNPAIISLYTRGSNADTGWILLTSASSVSAANNTATFTGITGFSQFIIAR